MSIDFLIVGQGLAGSLLAYELIKQHCRVLVIDNGEESASQVAAGLINPVTGQRLVKPPELECWLPVAKAYYQELAQQFGQTFWIEKPMLRILQSEKELQYAEQRLATPAYQAYLPGFVTTPANLQAPFGMLAQAQTAYLATRQLLNCLKTFLIAQGALVSAKLDYAELQLQPLIRWQHLTARQIIFCEGYQAVNNPWFARLPFQLAKGEILAMTMPAFTTEHMLNYGKWLIPLTDNHFKTGASFAPGIVDLRPTATAKSELLSALNRLFIALPHISVTEHKAGIRPATLDKQPMLGTHPTLDHMHIFNGFGSKGSLAIPWHVKQFSAYLLSQHPLPSTCNIGRYYATHFTA